MIPDYVICLECEAPCYVFEWREDKLIDALCTTCGNDDATQFVTEEEYEEMAMDSRFWPNRKT